MLKNEGDQSHTATADDGREFDLGRVTGRDLRPGHRSRWSPASYAFHCEIHPAMTATLTVEG